MGVELDRYDQVGMYDASGLEEAGRGTSAFYLNPELGGHIVAKLAEIIPLMTSSKVMVAGAMMDHFRIPESSAADFTVAVEDMLLNDGRTLTKA